MKWNLNRINNKIEKNIISITFNISFLVAIFQNCVIFGNNPNNKQTKIQNKITLFIQITDNLLLNN